MKILKGYLIRYKGLIGLALLFATINQCFSLIDPHITGKIVDDFINKKDSLSETEFTYGVLKLIGLAVGAAMVSRIAKNFQDYFANIITQKLANPFLVISQRRC